MNPDEAFIIYSDLLRAQNGIHLENDLHLLYLISPIEHTLMPDFKRLLSWHDRNKKLHSFDGKFVSLGEAIGLEEGYHYLVKWSYQTPSKESITSCFDKLCKVILKKPDKQKSMNISQPTQIEVEYFSFLCKCKRIWATLILDQIISSKKSITMLATEYSYQPGDLENLMMKTSMVCPYNCAL
jgi:hypothetical protein